MLDASRGARRISEALACVLAADLRPSISALRVPLGLLWGERAEWCRPLPCDRFASWSQALPLRPSRAPGTSRRSSDPRSSWRPSMRCSKSSPDQLRLRLDDNSVSART